MYKKILVPIDGSDHSIVALKNAAKLAISLVAGITIFHVIHHFTGHQTYSGKMGAVYHQLREHVKEEAEAIMEKARNEIKSYSSSFEEKLVWGDPADEITKEAQQGNYDLIIIGSRGLSEVKGWVLGSVSQRVVRHANCHVLVIK